MSIFLSGAELQPKPGKDTITLQDRAKEAGVAKGTVIRAGGQAGTKDGKAGFSYRLVGEEWPPAADPTPTPAPTPPSPTGPNVVIIGGEAFLTDGKNTIGINAFGGLGTANNAPDHMPTEKPLMLRAGMFLDGLGDVMMQGRKVEGFIVDGLANMLLAAWWQVPGRTEDDGSWRGHSDNIEILQRPTLLPGKLVLDIALTNLSDAIQRVKYVRAIDFDTNASYPTKNTVIKDGWQVELLKSGKTVGTMRFTMPGAYAAIEDALFNPHTAKFDKRAVGYKKDGDLAVVLVKTIDVPVDETMHLVVEYAWG